MSRSRLGTVAGLASLAAVLTVWGAPGCKKEKESLIVVEMEAIDANSTMLTDVTITVTTAAGCSGRKDSFAEAREQEQGKARETRQALTFRLEKT